MARLHPQSQSQQPGLGIRAMKFEKRQAFLQETSPVLLRNPTIEILRELSLDIPQKDKDKQNIVTFDDLIIDMIKVYRKHRTGVCRMCTTRRRTLSQ